jgi:hypothetical protein
VEIVRVTHPGAKFAVAAHVDGLPEGRAEAWVALAVQYPDEEEVKE